MSLSRPAGAGLLATALLTALITATVTGQQKTKQPKPPPPKGQADDLLKLPPRPKKPGLPPSALPLELVKGERIAFVGNSTAERFNLFGHFETLLHLRYPDKELVVRNFARPADEVGVRQRPGDYLRLG